MSIQFTPDEQAFRALVVHRLADAMRPCLDEAALKSLNMISLMMYSCSAVSVRRGAGATAGGAFAWTCTSSPDAHTKQSAQQKLRQQLANLNSFAEMSSRGARI